MEIAYRPTLVIYQQCTNESNPEKGVDGTFKETVIL